MSQIVENVLPGNGKESYEHC